MYAPVNTNQPKKTDVWQIANTLENLKIWISRFEKNRKIPKSSKNDQKWLKMTKSNILKNQNAPLTKKINR